MNGDKRRLEDYDEAMRRIKDATARNDQQAMALLKAFGMPFKS